MKNSKEFPFEKARRVTKRELALNLVRMLISIDTGRSVWHTLGHGYSCAHLRAYLYARTDSTLG